MRSSFFACTEIYKSYLVTTTTSESQNQMKCAFFLNIIVSQSSVILELNSCKDQPLLVWWYALLVLNLLFDDFNCVIWIYIKGDSLSC